MTPVLFLAEACNNTFIIADCLHLKNLTADLQQLIYDCLMQYKRDDAMILINGASNDHEFYLDMRVLGQDKIMGEFCGNGARAVAAYLFTHYKNYQQFFIRTTKQNRQLLHYHSDIYSIQLPIINFIPEPKFITTIDKFVPEGNFFKYHFHDHDLYYADAIEPHLVLTDALTDAEFLQLAQALNQDTHLFPQGINVNLSTVINADTIRNITYERGVQRFTASCGTGSSCAAALYLNSNQGTVAVYNPGGKLEISLNEDFTLLKGPATLTSLVTII